MNQTELLKYALHRARQTSVILDHAYREFPQNDIAVGVRLSALRVAAEALIQQITAAIMLEKGE